VTRVRTTLRGDYDKVETRSQRRYGDRWNIHTQNFIHRSTAVQFKKKANTQENLTKNSLKLITKLPKVDRILPFPLGKRGIVLFCIVLCLSVCSSCQNITKFSEYVACGSGSILPGQRCDALSEVISIFFLFFLVHFYLACRLLMK